MREIIACNNNVIGKVFAQPFLFSVIKEMDGKLIACNRSKGISITGPGVIYYVEEPEYVGAMPVRNERNAPVAKW